jgi:hypothetical protein
MRFGPFAPWPVPSGTTAPTPSQGTRFSHEVHSTMRVIAYSTTPLGHPVESSLQVFNQPYCSNEHSSLPEIVRVGFRSCHCALRLRLFEWVGYNTICTAALGVLPVERKGGKR